MGNTPTHRSYEGDASDGETASSATSLRSRVAGAVRAVAAGVRRRLSVFSGLDFGRAFHIEKESFAPDGQIPDDQTESPPPLPEVTSASEESLPKRDRPFTQPVHDREIQNDLDLEASREDDRLSIYYPDHDEATITSDTWQRIER
jgi:hypothetical protein